MQAQPSHVCGGPGICVCVRARHHYFNHRLTQATGMCSNSSKANVCVCVCVCERMSTGSYGVFSVAQRNNNNNNKQQHPRRKTHTIVSAHVILQLLRTCRHRYACPHLNTHAHAATEGLIMGCEGFGVTAYTRAQWHPIHLHLMLTYQNKISTSTVSCYSNLLKIL